MGEALIGPAQGPDRVRIGYLVPEFPGQTHTFFWREIKALERLGAEVVTLSTRRPRSGVTPHDWSADAIGRTTYLHPLGASEAAFAAAGLPGALAALAPVLRGRSLREAGEILATIPFALKLRAVSRRRKLDHLHLGSCAWTALIAAICRRLGGPRYSMTLHNPVGIFGGLQDLKWGEAAFGAAITRPVLEDLRARYGPRLPATLFIQPMGVDIEAFRRETPYDPWPGEGPLRIFSCGRLHPSKGHAITIEAVAALRGRGVDARLTIAGEDKAGGAGYRRELEAMIAERGLGDQVTLLGATGESEIVRQLTTAHLFVLASFEEPLGVAYMEAMSCGVPTIGTDAGGVPELITHDRDGYLIRPGRADAVAEAALAIARDPDRALRLSRNGRETVAARFRASIGAERILEAIRALPPETAPEGG